GRKARAQYVDRVEPGLQDALDVADDMLDVRVLLDRHLVGDPDGAGHRDAPDVIAREVDQHQVLGALLRVGEQFVGQRLVLLGRHAALAGPGEGTDGDALGLVATRRDRGGDARIGLVAYLDRLLAHQDLGRGTDHVEIPEVVVVHVRRGVDRAQRPIQPQRRMGERLAQALADLDLHHVAGNDVFLRARDGREIVVAGELADDLGFLAGRRIGRLRHGTAEPGA